MILDYKDNQIILSEERNENFLKIQELTSFNLCFRLRNGKYEVPLIALPILIKSCKQAHFLVKPTENLKNAFRVYQSNRKILLNLKEGKEYSKLQTRIGNINSFMDKMQEKHRFLLTEAQRQTIVYGIIGKRILIGNEIGTGKTLTANMIAKYFIWKKEVKKVLILVPASLVNNYHSDYIKFFGNKGIVKSGKEPKNKRKITYNNFRSLEDLNFLVTNFEKCNFDFDELKKLKIDLVIIDECHKLRNFLTAIRSENFFSLLENIWTPKFRIPMSGTPIENRLFDIYPIMKILSGGFILGGQKFFENNFVEYKTISFRIFTHGRYILRSEEKPIGFKNMEMLKDLIRPHIIKKRLKLPVGKYEQNVLIEPSKQMLEKMDKIIKTTNAGPAKYHRVRQFLCSPEREEYNDNPKLDELQNILDQTTEKIVIFSFYICSTNTIKKYLDEKGIKNLVISGEITDDPLKIINKFTEDKDIRVLISTDKISFGVNIQIAKILIEWELPIKPSITFQRVGRLYRTGQDKDVHVFSFIIKNTVEEIIYEQYEGKKEIIQKAIEELDDKKLMIIEREIESKIMEKFN